jgi:hypothetical protein
LFERLCEVSDALIQGGHHGAVDLPLLVLHVLAVLVYVVLVCLPR